MWQGILTCVNENWKFLTVIGAIWAFYKWHVAQQQKDAEFLRGQINEILTGKVRDVINRCDYEEKWYSADFHKKDCAYQKNVDYALTVFSCMCYMRSRGLMSRKAFGFFEYNYELLFSDEQVVDYLYNLYHNSRKEVMTFPFKHLLDYAFKRNLVQMKRSVFEDPTAWEREPSLHKYLDFE